MGTDPATARGTLGPRAYDNLSSRQEHWSGVAGVALCLLVGVVAVLEWMHQGTPPVPVLVAWVVAYVVYVAGLVLVWVADPPRGWLTSGRALAAVAVAGPVLALLLPAHGMTPILLVFTAAMAATLSTPRVAAALVVVNTLVIGLSGVLGRFSFTQIVVNVSIYGLIQVLVVFASLSERRRAEALQQLAVAHAELRGATALLAESSQARERLRIARELHDVLGHKLTALALELEVATHRSDPPARTHVDRARRVAKELLGDVRATVDELRARPPELRTALETLVAELPRPRVHLQVDDDVELDGAYVTALVRGSQEIVTNAIRHADADNLWIDIDASGGRGVVLLARDDGRGAPLLKLGNGLTGLRERVEQLGGTVTFDGRTGFQVRAELPPVGATAVSPP